MNKRGERARRHWIVFDGDVDPEWAENLNSVLDDNKILTLPSGERLEVPDNVRIMLEVQLVTLFARGSPILCCVTRGPRQPMLKGSTLCSQGHSTLCVEGAIFYHVYFDGLCHVEGTVHCSTLFGRGALVGYNDIYGK